MRLPLLLLLLALPALALAQGSLTPTGAPATTMRTLDQLDARTPLGTAGHVTTSTITIDQPGSYVLVGDITVSAGDGIAILSRNVTLDLNGFTILSTAGDNTVRGAGIEIAGGVTNVTLRHGHIRGTSTLVGTTFTAGGFDYGIYARTSTTTDILVEDLGVVGVVQNGISLPQRSVASHCTASVCGVGGINAQIVRDCVAEQCVLVGITAKAAENCIAKGNTGGLMVDTAVNCRGESAGSFNGIYADESVENCIGISIGGTGINAKTAVNSSGTSTDGIGVSATVATGCEGRSANNFGLSAGNAENCIGRSTAGIGLRATVATNCQGSSTSAHGLYAETTATGCNGSTSTGSHGLLARETAENCFGLTYAGTGTALEAGTATNCRARAANGPALVATTATNCHGKSTGSGTGLSAENATGCFGESTAGIGLQASMAFNCSAYTGSGTSAMSVAGTANSCRGNNGGTGSAIQAAIAIGCTSYRGAISAPQKFLGTP